MASDLGGRVVFIGGKMFTNASDDGNETVFRLELTENSEIFQCTKYFACELRRFVVAHDKFRYDHEMGDYDIFLKNIGSELMEIRRRVYALVGEDREGYINIPLAGLFKIMDPFYAMEEIEVEGIDGVSIRYSRAGRNDYNGNEPLTNDDIIFLFQTFKELVSKVYKTTIKMMMYLTEHRENGLSGFAYDSEPDVDEVYLFLGRWRDRFATYTHL